MFSEIEGAIFDLDGTLIDSMWVWEQIDYDYLSSLNHEVPKDLKSEITHLSFKETGKYFKKRFNIQSPLEDILNTWNNMALDLYSNKVKIKENVIEFLNYLKSQNIKIGLATSNSYPLLEAVLKNNNIYDYFDAITTTDEAHKNKSNPDVYLLAAKRLNVNPKNCIVFEDILEATKGAKLANMKVIAVYDKASEDETDKLKKYCDKYIYNFKELM